MCGRFARYSLSRELERCFKAHPAALEIQPNDNVAPTQEIPVIIQQEVRNLAIRTAEAAKNTSNLIEGTVKMIKDGSEVVARTNDAFHQVAGSSAKAADLVAEIAAASKEQAQGIAQINTAVAEMASSLSRTRPMPRNRHRPAKN